MLVGVDAPAEGQCFGFAFGCRFFRRVRAHRQHFLRFSGLLRRRFRRCLVFLAQHRRRFSKAPFVKLKRGHRLPHLVALAIPSGHPCALRIPRVARHQQFLPHNHARNAFHAINLPKRLDFQFRRHPCLFRRAHCQLAAIIGRRRQQKLLGLDFVPRLIAGEAVAAVGFGAVEIALPALGQSIQFINARHFHQAQATFKRRFHHIVGFFHLAFCPWLARLIYLHMHPQRLAKRFKCRAGIGRAGVEHHIPRHTPKRVFAQIRLGLHHVDKKVAKIGAGFAAEVIAHHNRAAGVVGAGVAPHPIQLDFLQVLRLVFIKLLIARHPQARVLAAFGQVIEHTQARVDLPPMVRVCRLQTRYRLRLKQLIRVQLVFPQRADNRAFRKRQHLARFLIHPRRLNLAVGAQHFHRRAHRHQALAVFAHRLNHQSADDFRLIAAQSRLPRIRAPLACRLQSHRRQLALQSRITHRQHLRLRLQISRLAAMPEPLRLPRNLAQPLVQSRIHIKPRRLRLSTIPAHHPSALPAAAQNARAKPRNRVSAD